MQIETHRDAVPIEKRLSSRVSNKHASLLKLFASGLHIPLIDFKAVRDPRGLAKSARRALMVAVVHASQKVSDCRGNEDGPRFGGEQSQEASRNGNPATVIRDSAYKLLGLLGQPVESVRLPNRCLGPFEKQLRFEPSHGRTKMMSAHAADKQLELIDLKTWKPPLLQPATLSDKLMRSQPYPELSEPDSASLVGPPCR